MMCKAVLHCEMMVRVEVSPTLADLPSSGHTFLLFVPSIVLLAIPHALNRMFFVLIDSLPLAKYLPSCTSDSLLLPQLHPLIFRHKVLQSDTSIL